MSEPESVLILETRGRIGIAQVAIPEILHPEELDEVRLQFRQYVASTDFRGYILDLSGLSYLTSAAIGMLMNVHAHLAAEGKRFAMVARADLVMETLQHTHLEKVFPIRTKLQDALAAIE